MLRRYDIDLEALKELDFSGITFNTSIRWPWGVMLLNWFFCYVNKFLLCNKVSCYADKIFATQILQSLFFLFQSLIFLFLSLFWFATQHFDFDLQHSFFFCYSSYFASVFIFKFLSHLSLLLNFFCFKCCFLFLFQALKVILPLIFFIFLVSYILILFFHFNMYLSFFCSSFFSVSHFFVFLFLYYYVFVTFCFLHLFCWPRSFDIY